MPSVVEERRVIPFRVEGQTLYAVAFRLELGQHGWCLALRFRARKLRNEEPKKLTNRLLRWCFRSPLSLLPLYDKWPSRFYNNKSFVWLFKKEKRNGNVRGNEEKKQKKKRKRNEMCPLFSCLSLLSLSLSRVRARRGLINSRRLSAPSLSLSLSLLSSSLLFSSFVFFFLFLFGFDRENLMVRLI